MAKRTGRKGAVKDLLAIAAKLPWWVSLVIAVVSFAVLHSVAGQDVGSVTSVQDIGGLAVKGLYRSLANFGQYIIPSIFLLGAVVSVIGQRNRRSLLVRCAENDSAAALHEMTWHEFTRLGIRGSASREIWAFAGESHVAALRDSRQKESEGDVDVETESNASRDSVTLRPAQGL